MVTLRRFCFPLIPLLFVSVAPLRADVIDFESLPNANLYLGGGQNIGTLYAGVDFESNVTGLDMTGSTAYPPHSGSIVVWDPVDASAIISFANPQTMVGLWYTSLDPITLAAFDGAGGTGTEIGSQVGAANTDGTSGSADFLSVSGADIASITLTGIPGDFVFDDLTYTPANPTALPETSSLAELAAVLLFCVFLDLRARKLNRSSKKC